MYLYRRIEQHSWNKEYCYRLKWLGKGFYKKEKVSIAGVDVHITDIGTSKEIIDSFCGKLQYLQTICELEVEIYKVT